jgi:hypothetical protein
MTKKKTSKQVLTKPDQKEPVVVVSETVETHYQKMIENIRGNIKLEVSEEGGLNLKGAKANMEKTLLKLIDTFGAKGSDAAFLLMQQVTSLDIKNAENPRKANQMMNLIYGIEPKDVIEGMLASQMVTIHDLMMDCASRAKASNQTFEGRQLNLNSAIKLSRSYVGLVDALNKHRGKGQQKMTVEHVHVNEGGQAIIGNVDNRKGGAGDAKQNS